MSFPASAFRFHNYKYQERERDTSMKKLKSLLFALFGTLAFCQAGHAATDKELASYPQKPITLVVGFTAGSATDAVARILAQRMGEKLKQTVVIDNKPGQGGGLAAAAIAKAAPDGYTIMVSGTGPLVINPTLYQKLPYDTLRDFAPIGMHTWLPYLLVVNPNARFKTLSEFLEYARANPDKVSFASSGNGSTAHLMMAMLAQRTGVRLMHVPYKGSAQAQTDVMGGQVDSVFDTVLSTMPHVRAGRLRAIASGSASRSELAPDVPTANEQGVAGFNGGAWLGMLAPARTPKPIIDKLNQALNETLAEPAIRQKLMAMGAEVRHTTPDEFSTFIKAEHADWSKLV
ncbi:MAG: Tat pathway signal sequence protein 13, partial [Burkholderia sp.]|nr:Tat pathway signal sequence protein 13 [Burkholderia sp.]